MINDRSLYYNAEAPDLRILLIWMWCSTVLNQATKKQQRLSQTGMSLDVVAGFTQ